MYVGGVESDSQLGLTFGPWMDSGLAYNLCPFIPVKGPHITDSLGSRMFVDHAFNQLTQLRFGSNRLEGSVGFVPGFV